MANKIDVLERIAELRQWSKCDEQFELYCQYMLQIVSKPVEERKIIEKIYLDCFFLSTITELEYKLCEVNKVIKVLEDYGC